VGRDKLELAALDAMSAATSMRRGGSVDWNRHGLWRKPGDLAGRDFDLRGSNDFMCPLDARDATAHQLGGAEARHDHKLERVRSGGTLNHVTYFLGRLARTPLVRTEAGIAAKLRKAGTSSIPRFTR
jgi:hypothetical protein